MRTLSLGFIIGFVASLFVQSLVSFVFWICIGLVMLFMLDLSIGLGRNACALRARIRSYVLRSWFVRAARHSGVVVVA